MIDDAKLIKRNESWICDINRDIGILKIKIAVREDDKRNLRKQNRELKGRE